jgi:zinc and cadmium transporter
MSAFSWVLIWSCGGSLLSVLAAGVYLLVPQGLRERSMTYLISFAIGMLLGAGFLHLLPEALANQAADVEALMATALIAILVFFMLEKGLVWRHHHHREHGAEEACAEAPAGTLILIGDSFHNFLDGALIAAAFHVDTELGTVTALAIIAHEIPQELGDFAILLHSGFSRSRALVFNLLTSLAMLAGAVVGWFTLATLSGLLPYLLAFTAASFIYVAVSDLMPTLNRDIGLQDTLRQACLIGAGLGCNLLAHA